MVDRLTFEPQSDEGQLAQPELQLIGNEWRKNGTSAVLEVPNVIIVTESSYMLNR